MATTAPVAAAKAPFLKGSIIWRKAGPLPIVAWVGIGLALVVAFLYIRRGRADAQAATALAGKDVSHLPGDSNAPAVFILPQPAFPGPTQAPAPAPAPKPPATPAPVPPGSGRSTPPATTPPAPPPARNPWINPDGTLSVGAGANLYAAAASVGLSGQQFAALNPVLWKPAAQGGNTMWSATRDAAGNLTPTALRGLPYRIS